MSSTRPMPAYTLAATDWEKMGLGVDVLTIQDISDEQGYRHPLGKRRAAEVKRRRHHRRSWSHARR